MEKKNVEFTVYNFNELKEDIKKQLIEEEIDNQRNLYCEELLYEDMKEKAIELLKKYFKNKATFKAVYYSLSNSQGDGAMIEFDLSYYGEDIEVKQEGHYYHERSFNYYYNFSESRAEQLNKKIIAMNKELGYYGYKLIDSDNFTDNDIIPILEDNQYLEDGSIYRY